MMKDNVFESKPLLSCPYAFYLRLRGSAALPLLRTPSTYQSAMTAALCHL